MTFFSSNWIILYPVAASLFVALRLAYGMRATYRASLFEEHIRGAVFLMLVASMFGLGLRFSFLSVFWLIALLIWCIVLIIKRIRLERFALFQTALVTTEPNERHIVASAFANSNRGWTRRAARRLLRDISLDVSWYDSLQRCRVVRTVYEQMTVRLQKRYGPEAMVVMREDSSEYVNPMTVEIELERHMARLSYFVWSLLVFIVIAAFMTFVAPTMEQIFEEFGLQPPALFEFLSRTGQGLTVLSWLVPCVIGATVGAAAVLWLFPSLLQVFPARILANKYYKSVGFLALAHTCEREENLVEATQTAADLIPVGFLSNKYGLAANRMSAGVPPAEALQGSGILTKKDLYFLGNINDRNPKWDLQQLAIDKCEAMLRHYSVLVQLVIATNTFVMGIIIGAFVISFFSALVLLINALA